jgi:hypothetical protein
MLFRSYLVAFLIGAAAFFSPLARLLSSNAGQLLLINPRRRSRRRRKMSAKQSRYFGGGRKRNPARRRRRSYRRNPQLLLNPRRGRSRRRRNPIALAGLSSGVSAFFNRPSIGGVLGVAKGAATGAAGAIAVDVIMGQAQRFIPASLLAPNVYPLVKAGAAIAFGVAGRRFLGATAVKMAEGSLICTARDWMRSLVPASIALGRYVDMAGLGYPSAGFLPPVPGQHNLGDDGLNGLSSNDVSEMAGTGMYVGT